METSLKGGRNSPAYFERYRKLASKVGQILSNLEGCRQARPIQHYESCKEA